MEQSSHSFVNLYRYILFLLFCGCLCAGASCGTGSTQNTASNQAANNLENKPLRKCITERTSKSIIRWGEYDPASGVTRAYQWGGDLQLKKLARENFKEQYTEETVLKTDEHSFCISLSETVKTFEKVPTLNSPGPISRFIEYYPAANKDVFRAVWNPRYRNVGSKDFRAIYDTLMTAVPDAGRW
jgi:hypothetical protein